MKTTIRISHTTKRMLDALRGDYDSYDKLLQAILPAHLTTRPSMAGAFPWLKWSKRDRMAFRGE